MININILKKVKKFDLSLSYKEKQGYCYACGENVDFIFKTAITDSLFNSWGLNIKQRKMFDIRESMVCNHCGNSLRTRMMAKTLVFLLSRNSGSLKQLTNEKKFNELTIAEINSCGNLHQFFLERQNIRYSEYRSRDNSIPHQDLEKLTYKSGSFDIVLTSETLEHVVNLEKALDEIHRVLKLGGLHIFTIPIISNRLTKNRLKFNDGRVEALLPDSYHGEEGVGFLVAHEFGGDIFGIIEEKGFEVGIYYLNPLVDTYSYVIVAKKV